jgi:D-alanyl-D-alanine carboxypeptidase
MTLYITFEALDKGMLKTDDELMVSKTAANRSPSRLGVNQGEKITVKTAIDALIVKSANDCATVLAEGLGYSEADFATKMTEIAEVLGMKNTTFKNASGLPNRQQMTTARDMVILGAALYHHFPRYYGLFSQKSFEYKGKTYYTHNDILKTFKGADGLKTGYIAAAGYNIVTSASRNGHRVIAVTMGHKTRRDRDKDIAQIMEKGLQKLALNNTQPPAAIYAKLEELYSFTIEKAQKPLQTKKEDIMEESPILESSAETVSRDNTQTWSVQVGAFTNYAKARSYALKLKDELPELRNKDVDIDPVESNFSVIYRSKLTNFSKNDADECCNNLKKINKSCIVISSNGIN